jgi:inner membrane protein YidH
MPDPRVFFAAERTLLAWMRSGLTIIALGFVVARFGLFLSVIAASSAVPAARGPHWASTALGIVLVVLGSATIVAALANHRAYVRSLPPQDVPQLPMPWLTPLVCLCVALLGFLLAGYLALA